MILLDTHALVWFLSDQSKINSKTLNLINVEYKKGEVKYSAISIWEICLLAKKGKLSFTKNIDLWVRNLKILPLLKSISLDDVIAQKSVFLEGFKNPDPADRIIIATALSLGCPLITKDKKIRDYKRVKTIW